MFLSGYCTAATLLGVPDFGYVTQTEMADVARRVCHAVPDRNVIVDGDTGYGNPLNTIRTIELYEHAGAAGIFLEDQVWPKKCGHMAGKQVVPRDEWLGKLRAALDHRDDLFVVARTDARAAVGLDEACARAQAAAELGRRRHLRRGARVGRGDGGDRRRDAGMHPGRQHDRGRPHAAAHARASCTTSAST